VVTSVSRMLALSACAVLAVAAETPPLMPWPASAQFSDGALEITGGFSISVAGAGAADPRVKAAVARTYARLARQTGMPIQPRLVATPNVAALRVIVEQADHRPPQQPGDNERYALDIAEGGARLSADRPLGVLRGLETFLQLVHQSPAGSAGTTPGFSVPFAAIRDEPRFPWRGLSLDVSRHFIPVDGIKRTLDGLAAVKLNVLHWHLSDDQGFRVESKVYPRLQQYGSDGLFYTQTEIRDVVAYARDRGIRIVPEFDVPGHASSWLPGYPSLGSRPGPFQLVRATGDPTGVLDPTKESTYRFLTAFFGEMMRLFPDPYFHIGGDEVNPREWNNEPRIRAFMHSHRLADAKQLQAYFNRRLEKLLAQYGKHMVGWDEILQPDLSKTVMIQSWRGQKSLAEAARAGYKGVLSAGYYLDLMQPASQHYAVDPLKGDTADLAPEDAKRILGGEAAMWEELATAETLDAKLWPRLAAIAERFWSPDSVTDRASMYGRLAATSRWLEWLGLTHRSNLDLIRRRLAGSLPVAPLAAFAELLEPVKGYERHRAGWGASTAFNRLVDAIPPESDAAREFNDAVDRYLAAPNPAAADSLRKQLAAWIQTAVAVRPLLEGNSLLSEDLPIADAVTALARAGSEALASRSVSAPPDWKAHAQAAIKDASAHRASLLVAIAPAIQKLVEAAPN
jgi:hexosaminidase